MYIAIYTCTTKRDEGILLLFSPIAIVPAILFISTYVAQYFAQSLAIKLAI